MSKETGRKVTAILVGGALLAFIVLALVYNFTTWPLPWR